MWNWLGLDILHAWTWRYSLITVCYGFPIITIITIIIINNFGGTHFWPVEGYTRMVEVSPIEVTFFWGPLHFIQTICWHLCLVIGEATYMYVCMYCTHVGCVHSFSCHSRVAILQMHIQVRSLPILVLPLITGHTLMGLGWTTQVFQRFGCRTSSKARRNHRILGSQTVSSFFWTAIYYYIILIIYIILYYIILYYILNIFYYILFNIF